MAADVFGRRTDDDVRPIIKRPHQAHADGVVHDQRHAGLMGDLRQGVEIRHIQLRVADGLSKDRARLRGDRLPERCRTLRIDELHLAAQLG